MREYTKIPAEVLKPASVQCNACGRLWTFDEGSSGLSDICEIQEISEIELRGGSALCIGECRNEMTAPDNLMPARPISARTGTRIHRSRIVEPN